MAAKPQQVTKPALLLSSPSVQRLKTIGNSVKVNVTMEEKLRRWKQSKQDASQGKKSSLGRGRHAAMNKSRPSGSKTKLIETVTMHKNHCLSVHKGSHHKLQTSSASPVSSVKLVANVKPRRLSKSDNCCKTLNLVQVDCCSSRNAQYPIVIDDNDVIPVIVSQDLPKVSLPVDITASTKNDRDTPILSSQLSPKSSKDSMLKRQENCRDDSTELNLDQPKMHRLVSVLRQKDTVLAGQTLSEEKEKREGSTVLDKENHVKLSVLFKHVLPELVTTVEKEPELLAKTLIKVAIGFEKRRRMTTAFSIFKRAYCILPKKSTKLAERLQRLADEWPEIVVQVPSQEMPTATYMKKVLECDLMDVLNHGTTKELTELFTIGNKRAELVIDERPFDQLVELERVLGMSTKAVAKLYEHHTNWGNH